MKYKFGPFLTQFFVNNITTGVKTAVFWERDLSNKLLTKFHQILLSVFLSRLIHDIQLWVLFTQLEDNDITVETNILEFWKNGNSRNCKSFCCCLVAMCYIETVLKNFGKWCRHKGAPVSHLSPSILQKCCNFCVLKQVLSICTNFHLDWLKISPDIRNLVFLLNEELYRKFTAVPKVCQRWRHKWNTKTGITLDIDLILTCGFFKKSYLWKAFYLTK